MTQSNPILTLWTIGDWLQLVQIGVHFKTFHSETTWLSSEAGFSKGCATFPCGNLHRTSACRRLLILDIHEEVILWQQVILCRMFTSSKHGGFFSPPFSSSDRQFRALSQPTCFLMHPDWSTVLFHVADLNFSSLLEGTRFKARSVNEILVSVNVWLEKLMTKLSFMEINNVFSTVWYMHPIFTAMWASAGIYQILVSEGKTNREDTELALSWWVHDYAQDLHLKLVSVPGFKRKREFAG